MTGKEKLELIARLSQENLDLKTRLENTEIYRQMWKDKWEEVVSEARDRDVTISELTEANRNYALEIARLEGKYINLKTDAETWCEANGRLIGGLAALKDWIMQDAHMQIERAELIDGMNRHGLWADIES